MSLLSGTFSATTTAGGVLVYNGPAVINSIQICATTIGTSLTANFTIYDNNVATSVTNANNGQTWAGKSPGYSGQGPGTQRIAPNFLQSARTGDQQGQTAPNGATAAPTWTGPDYWSVVLGTGEPDYAAAPVDKATVAALVITGVGSDSYRQLNLTNPVGNVVAADTTATALYSVTLAAGQCATFLPPGVVGVNFGIYIVATSAGATGITASYNADIVPTP
jgi:hypothetical protein